MRRHLLAGVVSTSLLLCGCGQKEKAVPQAENEARDVYTGKYEEAIARLVNQHVAEVKAHQTKYGEDWVFHSADSPTLPAWSVQFQPCFTKPFPEGFNRSEQPIVGGGMDVVFTGEPAKDGIGLPCTLRTRYLGKGVYSVDSQRGAVSNSWLVDLTNGAMEMTADDHP